jgi:hypothetical protein
MRQAFARHTTLWARPSRESSLWWAHLSPGGPALLGFRPSSTRLDGASERQRSARTSFGPEALRTLRRGRDAPVAGNASDPCATACAAADAVLHSPEPVELSPAGVSFESLRFGDRARNRSALDPGKLLTDPSDGASGFRAKNSGKIHFHSTVASGRHLVTRFHQMKKVIHPFESPHQDPRARALRRKRHEKGPFHARFLHARLGSSNRMKIRNTRSLTGAVEITARFDFAARGRGP